MCSELFERHADDTAQWQLLQHAEEYSLCNDAVVQGHETRLREDFR